MKPKKGLKFELIPTKYSQYSSPLIDLFHDIEILEIPSKYIESIEVGYSNGITITLTDEQIQKPIPVTRNNKNVNQDKRFEDVSSVRVFINLDAVEKDIDDRIDKMFEGKIRM